MNDGELFSSLSLNGKPLKNCEMALECDGAHYRLYVDREPERNTFYAMAVEFVSSEVGGNVWDCKNLMVNQLFNSTAYFDGVRHLEFNRKAGDMAGYIYYPNIQGLADMLSKLREIELELCGDCDKQI